MRIGVLSDTHGRQERAHAAVRLLDRLGAGLLVHCGDIGSAAVLDALAGHDAAFVWGNTDHDAAALARYARAIGLQPPEGCPRLLEREGCSIRVYHGHEREFSRLLRSLMSDEQARGPAGGAPPDIVFYGHTHAADARRIGPTLLVNPGALHRAAHHTVATVDLPDRTVTYWKVDAKQEHEPTPIALEDI